MNRTIQGKAISRIPVTLCIVGLASVVAELHSSPVFWNPAAGGNGHYYEVVTASSGILWTAAKTQAEKQGGYLACITTAQENDFVFSLIKDDLRVWIQDGTLWIGPWIGGLQPASSSEPAGGWKWVNGEPMVFTAWSSGEPNNLLGDDVTNFQSRTTRLPTWNDLPSATWSRVHGFVIEYDYSTSPPSFTSQPIGQTIDAGRSLTLSASALVAERYQWVRNGAPISGATNSVLTIPRVAVSDAGLYTLLASNSIGTTSSTPAVVMVIAPRLVNLSVRSAAGAGDQTLIVGFAVGGTGSKQILVRGVGPTLAQLGVNGALLDPQLRVFNSSRGLVSENDNWGGGSIMAAIFARVGAFGLPAASRDAALSASLPQGSYTAQLTGESGSVGIALVECYDADGAASGSNASLVNLSARNQVGTGESILIAGFVITGFAPKTLLIRGIGPTLAQFGVVGVLANPRVQLFNGATLIADNDNWGGSQTLVTIFEQVGAFGLAGTSLDAAMVLVLQPGTYTAQVSGVVGTTGVALLEIYDVP